MAINSTKTYRHWLVLVQLLYGRHSCVVWQSQRNCIMDKVAFATAIGLHPGVLVANLIKLKEYGYFTNLDVERKFAAIELKEMPVREFQDVPAKFKTYKRFIA